MQMNSLDNQIIEERLTLDLSRSVSNKVSNISLVFFNPINQNISIIFFLVLMIQSMVDKNETQVIVRLVMVLEGKTHINVCVIRLMSMLFALVDEFLI